MGGTSMTSLLEMDLLHKIVHPPEPHLVATPADTFYPNGLSCRRLREGWLGGTWQVLVVLPLKQPPLFGSPLPSANGLLGSTILSDFLAGTTVQSRSGDTGGTGTQQCHQSQQ